jgi:signal transduction histidine kinase
MSLGYEDLMENPVLSVAFWCVAVGLLTVVILLVRQRRMSVRLSDRNAALEDGLRLRDEEARHLLTARLPALVESLQGLPVEVPGARHQELTATPHAQNLQAVLDLFAQSVQDATARAEESAKSGLKAMMRSVQSLANEQQLAISTMQDRHDDADVLQDLLKIDHTNSQLGRRAQATAVLCGSWPGQQRSASSLVDVVRGATSRIRDYLRVRLHAQVELGVVSRAVEPVVLAVAELLDNAARHSQPNTSVEVNFQPAHHGIAIMIDDAGVGMNAEELQHATRLLSGQQPVEINRIGDPPQIGFAVIGVLAARYGFTVSVDTRSPYGGVRAVVFLPTELLTRLVDRQEPVASAAAPGSSWPDGAQPPRTTVGGLPKRRRNDPANSQRTVGVHGSTEAVTPATSPSRARGLGAWQRGTRSGRQQHRQ